MKISTLIGVAGLLLSSVGFAGEKIDKTLAVPANGQVTIESMRGEVEIVGWDRNEMSVQGELDDKAEGYVFASENGFTTFKVKMPKFMGRGRDWNGSKGSMLSIKVPKGSRLVFESVNGGVEVSAISGGSDVHTVNGNVSAESLSDRVKLETVNGNIKSKHLSGKIKLSTVNGKIVDIGSKGKVAYTTVNGRLNADTAAGKVYVENVNGEIELSLKRIEDLEIATVNGDIDVSTGLAEDASVNITTVSGSARLVLDGSVSGKFRLTSHAGGSIKNRLTDDEVKKPKYGPGSSLKFKLGDSDANVEMATVSGNLTIERK